MGFEPGVRLPVRSKILVLVRARLVAKRLFQLVISAATFPAHDLRYRPVPRGSFAISFANWQAQERPLSPSRANLQLTDIVIIHCWLEGGNSGRRSLHLALCDARGERLRHHPCPGSRNQFAAARRIRDQSSCVVAESWFPAARRQCRSSSFSLPRYLELLSIMVPRVQRARLLISYLCCSTRAQGRTLRPFSGKPLPKISDLQRVVTRRT